MIIPTTNREAITVGCSVEISTEHINTYNNANIDTSGHQA